jgi:hypothetical protein
VTSYYRRTSQSVRDRASEEQNREIHGEKINQQSLHVDIFLHHGRQTGKQFEHKSRRKAHRPHNQQEIENGGLPGAGRKTWGGSDNRITKSVFHWTYDTKPRTEDRGIQIRWRRLKRGVVRDEAAPRDGQRHEELNRGQKNRTDKSSELRTENGELLQ